MKRSFSGSFIEIIVVITIFVNLLAGVVTSNEAWASIDMTSISLYTLSDDTIKMVKKDEASIIKKYLNNGGKWTIESDSSVNVSRSTINSKMLSKLVEIDASDKISSPSDIKDYGFTKKNEEITGSTNNIIVTDSNGKNYEIYFGSVNPYDSTLYYMMVKGDDNVYTVSSDLNESHS